MKKAFFAKLFGYAGAGLSALGAAHVLGKYSGLAVELGAILSGLGIHQASATDGSK